MVPALAFSLALLGVVLVGLGVAFDRRRLPATPADAALVFGCGLDWKVNARLRTSLRVYLDGHARHLVVSGGVPTSAISLENRATNTGENAALALPILQGLGARRVILIMSDFEGIRAHLTARRAWFGQAIEIFDCHAPSDGHWNRWTWWLSREGWRLTWYTLPRLFRYRLLPWLWT